MERNSGTAFAFPIHIGDYTVIGSISVVKKDIPANVVAAGNPCRVIPDIPQPGQS